MNQIGFSDLSDLYICCYTTAEKWKLDFFQSLNHEDFYLKPRFLIKSGYYIVPYNLFPLLPYILQRRYYLDDNGWFESPVFLSRRLPACSTAYWFSKTHIVGVCCLESVHFLSSCQYYEVYTIFVSFNIYLKTTLAVDHSQLIMLSQIIRFFRNRVNRF